MSESPFRRLPAVHAILNRIPAEWPREAASSAIRRELDALRQAIRDGQSPDIDEVSIAGRVVRQLSEQLGPYFRRVINATGIVLHTNLGRSPLAEAAADASRMAASGYVNLELDLETGRRSSRQAPLRSLLNSLTGSESATAVNNCAAATVIVLRTLASGKEVIISRGQLIEIGGSFRIPDILGVSGAILREVGTTNITRLSDYERAIGPNTGLLMRVHPSNYRIRGFTKQVPLADLVALGRKHRLPVIDDLGSGALLDFAPFGLPGEPVAADSLQTGADLILFSADKLLGGPQAGIIAGRESLIRQIERDPLMRALRLDKMTLAGLEATLRLHRDQPEAIPIVQMLRTSQAELRSRAERLAASIAGLEGLTQVQVCEVDAFVGGGSLPDTPLRSVAVSLRCAIGESELARRLRVGTPAVLARIRGRRLLLDLRTIFPGQEPELLAAIAEAVQNHGTFRDPLRSNE